MICTPSLQVGAWQIRGEQTGARAIGGDTAGVAVGAGSAESATAVEVGFVLICTPSLQVGAWQIEAEQTELEQSVAMAQESPSAQGEQRAPPQSRSDSS